MTTPKEIEVQEWIQSLLVKREIYPFTVFYTYIGGSGGTLGLSFYSRFDLDELLEMLEYRSLCDKSGFRVIPETNTLIVTSQAIIYVGERLEYGK